MFGFMLIIVGIVIKKLVSHIIPNDKTMNELKKGKENKASVPTPDCSLSVHQPPQSADY
ncbi:unnamed protein product [Didymodactylos carnosus]|uniref:Uncharacterized protein n=1 Tax=Didymodactylos carnosus TaxID=1234261 RepID=A0A816FTP9_9BILA|nr:unnamed protein product [Didymodactylos carnosus]CAF4623414.1 unnamed protein product [Didymodactylos carnosus]